MAGASTPTAAPNPTAAVARARPWPSVRNVAVATLLGAGFLLRLWTAHAYWSWFDREFPGAWERSRTVLSQDGTQYVQQADPDTWQRPFRGRWQERPYYRPPLASHYFAFLCQRQGSIAWRSPRVRPCSALLAYFLIYRLVARAFGYWPALASLSWSLLHPVLVYFDVSFEDGALAFVLLALAIAVFVRHVDGSPWGLAVAGAFMGLAILARPNTALAFVCLLVVLAASARGTPSRRGARFHRCPS